MKLNIPKKWFVEHIKQESDCEIGAGNPNFMNSPKIIQNALKITEGKKVTYIKSLHTHDFVCYTFKNGGDVFTDGGCSYIRRGGTEDIPKNVKVEDWSLTESDSYDTIKERLVWGTYGKKGNRKLKYVPLTKLTKSHLENILKDYSGKGLHPLYEQVINDILNNDMVAELKKVRERVSKYSVAKKQRLFERGLKIINGEK